MTTETATAAEIEQYLRSVLGRTEHPANSNHVFVWTELIRRKLAPPGFQGQPWCAGLIVLSDAKVGAPILPVQSPYYVPSRIQYARAHGLWIPGHLVQEQGRPGDETCWAFSRSAIAAGLGEHVERLIRRPAATSLRDIGGNTSSTAGGSQDNGGTIAERTRPIDETLLGAVAYSRLLGHDHAPRHKVRRNPFAGALRRIDLRHYPLHFGAKGDAVRAVQWAAGCPVDGVWGIQTEHAVRHFQRYHRSRDGRRLIPDGQVGPLTAWALLQITHYEHS